MQITPGAASSYLARALSACQLDVSCFQVPVKRQPAAIWQTLSSAPDFSAYAGIVAVGYPLAFACGLRASLTRVKTPVIGLGLNLSASPLRFGLRPLDRLMDAPFRHLALSIVHSRREMALFEDLHGLDRTRLAFAHWGFDLPPFDPAAFTGRKPYVCMIGRNNRDIETFCTATQLAGVNGVVVAPSYSKVDFNLPENVELRRELSFEECLACISGAEVNVILVKDDERGAGHITAVAAMHLGTPQIYTRASVLGDYLIDGVTGIATSLGDAPAVAAAFARIRDGRAAASDMAAAAKAYAARWLSHDATARRQAELIAAAVDGAPFERVHPGWRQEHGAAQRAMTSQ